MTTATQTFQEFQESAIPDWYVPHAFDTELYPEDLAEILRGDFEWTGRNGAGQRIEYWTMRDRRRYDFWDEYVENGGWVAIQARLSGIQDSPAYLKLKTPRRDYKTGKPVKYETPKGSEARPLLSPFTWEMGLATVVRHCPKRVEGTYRKRFEAGGADLGDIDEGFWDFVEANPEIPIVIEEGWKKGCALAVRGYPTVALRGVRCFFRGKQHKFDLSVPHAVNERLFGKGRRVTFAFDEDEKESTRKDVAKALREIANWLENRKCKVSIASWDKESGKGIDDVLYAIQSRDGEDAARHWLDETIGNAEPYKSWKSADRIRKTLAKIDALDRLSFAGSNVMFCDERMYSSGISVPDSTLTRDREIAPVAVLVFYPRSRAGELGQGGGVVSEGLDFSVAALASANQFVLGYSPCPWKNPSIERACLTRSTPDRGPTHLDFPRRASNSSRRW